MAIDLSRPQSDPSLYARDARGIATSRQLDFLEFVRDDGTLISSAQWPGRIGFKNDWVTQQTDWNQQKAFLAKVELPDTVDLGLLAVRIVNVGEKKLYIIGGRRLDTDFLQALTVPEGMQVFFYRNLESAFVPDALVDSEGPASQPERFSSLIESMQRQPRAGEYEIPGATAPEPEKFSGPSAHRPKQRIAGGRTGGQSTGLSREDFDIHSQCGTRDRGGWNSPCADLFLVHFAAGERSSGTPGKRRTRTWRGPLEREGGYASARRGGPRGARLQ